MRQNVDVASLFRLWNDESMTRAEIARELGVTAGQLTRLASRHGLGVRGRKHRAFSMTDPSPDEIERLKAELKAKHIQERMREDVTNTQSKVSKWRNGICSPRGVA
jgi:transposase-like protein